MRRAAVCGDGGEVVDYPAGQERANKHARSVGDEGDHALCGSAVGRRGFAVDVDLAGDEEEVVADAVKQDAEIEHPDACAGVTEGEQHIAQRPRRHASDEHVLDAESAEEPGDEEHAEEFRTLAHCHFSGRAGDADFRQEEISEYVIKLKRNADEERCQHKDEERLVFEQLHGFRWNDGLVALNSSRLSGGVCGSVRA